MPDENQSDHGLPVEHNEHIYESPEDYQDNEDSIMDNLNESDEKVYQSNEGDSSEHSLVPASHASYGIIEPENINVNDHSDHYMVLYNGNAEVIGNFRALNFYKASDINIKEDVRLLIDDRDPRSVLLKIDGVEYKFKQGATNAPMNKRFVGYIAQQIESVVPEAVQLIDGILHVDYESLIPYLSESIKQNFRDISDMKTDANQIHQVIDMLYAEFIKKEQKKSEMKTAGTKERTRNRSLGWIVGASLAFVLLVSIAVGVFFIVPFVHTPPPSSKAPSPPSPQISPAPSTVFPSPDQDVLVELYHSAGGKMWDGNASPALSVCDCTGVQCDDDFRVISLRTSIYLVGTLPDSIGKLNKLTQLMIPSNYLQGTIPASIGNLTSLVELYIQNTQVSGSVPLELFSLTSLEYLILNGNRLLSWTIPPQISNLKNLKDFNAEGSGLHGTIPDEISKLTNLTSLSLGNNELNGTVPNLANTNMKDLLLRGNLLSGPVPKMKEKISAHNIDLGNNNFSSEFYLPPSSIQTADRLAIDGNKFTSVSPKLENITFAHGHVACNAENNLFKCPIPAWLRAHCQASCS